MTKPARSGSPPQRMPVDVISMSSMALFELAIDAAHAPRPLVVDHGLEAEDQLVLIDRIHVRIDFAAQIADRAIALRIVDGAELRAEDGLGSA